MQLFSHKKRFSDQQYYLLKVMNSQPYFSLSIEHTAKITPGHCKTGLCFYCFQVARLSIQKWAAKWGQKKLTGKAHSKQ